MDSSDSTDHPIYLFKYGGNAMLNEDLQFKILRSICDLTRKGVRVVIVHGGGPFIKAALEQAGIESEFVDGQRITTPEAFEHVEMALKGKVNSKLVNLANKLGHKAVGLSGKDGCIVEARKRQHQTADNFAIDLGQVGDVAAVQPELLNTLLNEGYIPIITCIAADKKGNEYNINADMFAGNLAGALKASQYIVLTDVDGLLRDKDDPSTMIRELSMQDIATLYEQNIVQGGMIPKMESCEIALSNGAEVARIINGTKPEQISALLQDKQIGTRITKGNTA